MSGQTFSQICVVYRVMKSTIILSCFSFEQWQCWRQMIAIEMQAKLFICNFFTCHNFYFNWLYFLLKCLLCNNWLNLFRLSLCLSSLHDDIFCQFCMYSSRLYVQLLAKIPWFLKLQVNPKSVKFFQHEIDVLLVTSLVWRENLY